MAGPIVLSPAELTQLCAWYEARVQTALATWSGRASDRARLTGLQTRLADLTAALADLDPLPEPAAAPAIQPAGIMLPPGFQA